MSFLDHQTELNCLDGIHRVVELHIAFFQDIWTPCVITSLRTALWLDHFVFFSVFLWGKTNLMKKKKIPQNTVWILLGTHYYCFLMLPFLQYNFCINSVWYNILICPHNNFIDGIYIHLQFKWSEYIESACKWGPGPVSMQVSDTIISHLSKSDS